MEKENEKTNEEPIHAIPLQMVKYEDYEYNDTMNLIEPQIVALEDLSDLEEDKERHEVKRKGC